MTKFWYYAFSLCLPWSFIELAYVRQGPTPKEKPYASILYTAVVRGKVALPCDISSPSTDDSAALILWYKDDSAQPIYTLDARKGNVDQAHQSSGHQLENRAYFNMINRPAFLQLDPDDAGEYRGRVDFHKARTVNTVITLKVIVPPKEPIIVDENGKQLKGLVGPFNEGQSLTLTCSVTGGKPRPSLTWWRDYTLLDDNYTFGSDEMVQNKIIIPELERDDFRVVLTCQASNNNITIPSSTTITLKLNLKPIEIEITPSHRPMSADKEVKLTCVTRGSRPPAKITWWKGSEQLATSGGSMITEGDTTTSIFKFLPSVEDNGKYLSCRAENTKVPGSGIERGWNIEVHYPPSVSLRVVSYSKKQDIEEGDDVTFECDIKANPWVNEIKWHFNTDELVSNPSLGVVISSQSMVLQSVKKRFRGKFFCSATNSEGVGTSNEIFLKVKYAPVCQPGQKSIYGVLNKESVQVLCQLDSDPNDITFHWRFNSSAKVTDKILHTIHSNKCQSTASYSIQTDEDYGTLLCWGENTIGVQKDPCVFKIILAEPPEPVQNCSIFNRTEELILVECLEGFDGGLEQTFMIEVYTKESGALHAKVSSPVPVFSVNGLTPGTFYRLLVYAVNRKGRSSIVTLSSSTIRPAEKLTGERAGMLVSSSILAVFIGSTVALVFLVIILIIVIKIRKRRILKAQRESSARDKLEVPLKKNVGDVSEGPDIIPAKNLNRERYLGCKKDPEEKCIQLHVTPSSTQSYFVKEELMISSPSSSKEVIYLPEISYRSPIHNLGVRSQGRASPQPQDKTQRYTASPETGLHTKQQEKNSGQSSQDNPKRGTEEEDQPIIPSMSVLNNKQESAV
ncbi:neural cell adhesion molecule 1-like [Limulus polyphemus]|uniref:Neural cell adhesion molecule 1-like n=1 Tax=Limulus polyphemus TaxID=6850 RepID=A0ABM1SNI7_LIMPO|nr:neural cell adhesion molecule 1-like [Limulus polyphemus]